MPVYGDGLNVRDWIHVEDHCRALSLVLQEGREGEIYNIGGTEKETTWKLLRPSLAYWENQNPWFVLLPIAQGTTGVMLLIFRRFKKIWAGRRSTLSKKALPKPFVGTSAMKSGGRGSRAEPIEIFTGNITKSD